MVHSALTRDLTVTVSGRQSPQYMRLCDGKEVVGFIWLSNTCVWDDRSVVSVTDEEQKRDKYTTSHNNIEAPWSEKPKHQGSVEIIPQYEPRQLHVVWIRGGQGRSFWKNGVLQWWEDVQTDGRGTETTTDTKDEKKRNRNKLESQTIPILFHVSRNTFIIKYSLWKHLKAICVDVLWLLSAV